MATSRRAVARKGTTAVAARVLKKYPNRRLYDTEVSRYITLAEVKAMVLDGIDFEVRDAKTHEDLTRAILLQIILEEETGGVPIFSTATLSQIIRFYGHAMQGLMGTYLEKNLQTFADLQSRLPGPELWTPFMFPGRGPSAPAGAGRDETASSVADPAKPARRRSRR